MITDEGIQRIKKNLPAYELKLFQSFLSEYHNTKQMLETKEFELSQILKERDHFDKLLKNEIEDLKDELSDHD